jgi:holo-[acyl-carrier protein] synthase
MPFLKCAAAWIRPAPDDRSMILGIGADLANIERIQGTIDRFGDRFIQRIFTEREQAKANSRAHGLAATYAKRWAAKEACSKALGTGLRMGIAWRDMAVSNIASGQPVMSVTGWAAERLSRMTPPDHQAVIHVTLTDDHPWAQAFVVIEALPVQRAQESVARLTGACPPPI